MKLPVIEGREVVPVRLIPFVTQQHLGQQVLSQILTHRWRVDGFPKRKWFLDDPDDIDDENDSVTTDKTKLPNSFHAYLLNEEGKAVRMLTTEWDIVVRNMEPIEPMLRIEEEQIGVRNAKESEWFEKTLKMLPESAFMRREDFERLWCVRNGCILSLPGERPDVRRINYDAYIRQECRGLVWDFWKPYRELMDKGGVTKPESSTGLNIVSVSVEEPAVPLAPVGDEMETVRLTIEQIIKTPKSERSPLFAEYYEQRCSEGARKELIAAEMWANNTCASYTTIDIFLNGPDAPGNDTRKCQRGKELVEKGIELQKKMQLKKQVN